MGIRQSRVNSTDVGKPEVGHQEKCRSFLLPRDSDAFSGPSILGHRRQISGKLHSHFHVPIEVSVSGVHCLVPPYRSVLATVLCYWNGVSNLHSKSVVTNYKICSNQLHFYVRIVNTLKS